MCLGKNNFKITTVAHYFKIVNFGPKPAITSPLFKTAHKNMCLMYQITGGARQPCKNSSPKFAFQKFFTIL